VDAGLSGSVLETNKQTFMITRLPRFYIGRGQLDHMDVSKIPVKKGLSNPTRVPGYLLDQCILDPLSKSHSAIIKDKYQQQPVKLAELREKEDNFCLIVLDACRYDYFDDEFDDYFYGRSEPMWAASINTFEYLRINWTETYEYPYVTGAAPVTSQRFNFDIGENIDGIATDGAELLQRYCGYIPDNHLEDLIEVWRSSWDEDLGVCPPEPVTKRGISLSKDASRMVVHYFQPHGPFIGSEKLKGHIEKYDSNVEGGAVEMGIWEAARSGDLSKSKLRNMYKSNLKRALAAVCELIRQTNFEKYVIIGDHGEALGEYGKYYHSIEHPKVRLVPWAIVEDVQDVAPDMWEYTTEGRGVDKPAEERLRELGYLE
jgi:hypothetical protein